MARNEAFIDTTLNTDGVTTGARQIEQTMTRMAENVSRTAQNAANQVNRSFESLNMQPTPEYAELEKEFEKIEEKIEKIGKAQDRYLATGGRTNTTTWRRYEYDLEELGKQQDRVIERMREMEAAGTAYQAPERQLESQLAANETARTNQNLNEYNRNLDTNAQRTNRAAKEQRRLNNEQKKGSKAFAGLTRKIKDQKKSFMSGFKTLLKYTLGIRSLYVLFNRLRRGLIDGFKNLAAFNDGLNPTNRALSNLMSAMTRLKNSFATAFAPILTVVEPILTRMINAISKAVTAIGMLIAKLQGAKTFIKAKEVQQDFNDSLGETADKAKKAKQYLSGLDEVRTFTSSEDEKSGLSANDMFEEVPIEDFKFGDMLDKIKEKLKELIDLFIQGFKDGLGDWKSRLANILENLKSIKDSMIAIFTDPEVVKAAERFAESFLYNLGRIAGSVASIGLTIAQNLVGGLQKYLEQNQDRIKEFFVTAFDVGASIMNQLGDLSEAIAFIFEPFGEENGQQLTANLIGIFADAFMGIEEVALKFSNDLLSVITKPIVDNQEGFRTAFDGLLGTAATVTGTMKDLIDSIVDKLNGVYDEHIGPFIQSIAEGLSELTKAFLEFWNTNVQPTLDRMAERVDRIVKEQIQPAVENLLDLVGAIADRLKAIWEKVLQPLIKWIIENVLPVILPVLETIYNTVVDAIGYIIAAIGDVIKVIKGVIDFVTGVFTGDWDKAWQGISDIVSGTMQLISDIIGGILKTIGNVVKGALELISAKFNVVFTAIGSLVNTIFTKIADTITGIMGSIKDGIESVLNTIEETWVNMWTSIKETTIGIVDDLWNGIKYAINTILGGIEMMINGVITGLNNMITAVNGLHFDLPDWVPLIGGKSLGFTIPLLSSVSVPRLAQGTVVPRSASEFAAILGDNNKETEVVSPLSTIEQALENVMARKGSGNITIHNVTKLNSRVLLDEMIEEAQRRMMNNGENPFNLGVI